MKIMKVRVYFNPKGKNALTLSVLKMYLDFEKPQIK